MSIAAIARPDAWAWFVLGMLCFVYILNVLDRQLLAILAKPIQDDLQVSGQLGLTSGRYFALCYCLISIPVRWLADRANRVRVLSCAGALWSAATVACGRSSTYPQLVAARRALSPAVALVQEEVRPAQRVLAGALLLLVMNLIGLGLEPSYLGAVSDLLRSSHPDSSLQLACYTLVPFYVLAGVLCTVLGRKLRCEAAITIGVQH